MGVLNMRKYTHRYKCNKEKIIGATLLLIGIIIFINSIAIRFLLLLISLALLVMGIIIYMK